MHRSFKWCFSLKLSLSLSLFYFTCMHAYRMCIYAMPHGGVDALLYVLEVLRTVVWIVGSCYLRLVFHFFSTYHIVLNCFGTWNPIPLLAFDGIQFLQMFRRCICALYSFIYVVSCYFMILLLKEVVLGICRET